MNGSTMIESREKVISNIATEERNTHNLTPLIASDMTFFKVSTDERPPWLVLLVKLNYIVYHRNMMIVMILHKTRFIM